MPRQARLIIDNACYHVITRGNRKNDIFRENEDYRVYMKLLSRYKARYKFKLYGWCLMSNHIHLVVETEHLSRIMHGLNLSYALYFKYKYDEIGHFWQDRFKSFVINRDEYLINCITYIENNPVRASLAKGPEDYAWSSYRDRICGKDSKMLDAIVC